MAKKAKASKPKKTAKCRSTEHSDDTFMREELASLMMSARDLLQKGRGELDAILNSVYPSTLKGQLKKAQTMRRENDFARKVCDISSRFFSAGMKIGIKSSKSKTAERGEAIREFRFKHNLNRITKEMCKDWKSAENFILTWKVGKFEGIDYVANIDPASVEYSNVLGHEVLRVAIDPQVKKRVNEAQRGGKKALEQLARELPAKYIKAANRGSGFVELSHEDGEYWYVASNTRPLTGLAYPSMATVFRDLELRNMIISGDLALNFFLKRAIQLVQHGESIDSGPLAGSTKNYTSPKQIANIKKLFTDTVAECMRIFADHTLQIKYIVPPAEAFDPIKYQEVEKRLIAWGGICGALLTGEGNYAAAHLGVRAFIAEGVDTRSEITRAFQMMFRDSRVKNALGLKRGDEVEITFDEQNLKDPKQVLSELVALFDRGAMDFWTLCEKCGFDPEAIFERKREELKAQEKEPGIFVPAHEPSQGITGDYLSKYIFDTDETAQPSDETTKNKKRTKTPRRSAGRPEKGLDKKTGGIEGSPKPRPSTTGE